MNIPPPLLQAIANYLATKPYQEVAGLLAEISKLPQDNPPKEVKEVKS